MGVRGRAAGIGVVVVAGVVGVAAWGGRGTSRVVWQQAQTPSVRLAVRDKEGTLGSYKVAFRVRGPDGDYVASVAVQGQEWAEACFPSDFVHYGTDGRSWKAWDKPGRYFWRGTVNGKDVSSGTFQVNEPQSAKGVRRASVVTFDPM